MTVRPGSLCTKARGGCEARGGGRPLKCMRGQTPCPRLDSDRVGAVSRSCAFGRGLSEPEAPDPSGCCCSSCNCATNEVPQDDPTEEESWQLSFSDPDPDPLAGPLTHFATCLERARLARREGWATSLAEAATADWRSTVCPGPDPRPPRSADQTDESAERAASTSACDNGTHIHRSLALGSTCFLTASHRRRHQASSCTKF